MDPITLATITSSLTTLAMECAKGAAGAAGKELWGKVKSMLGWRDEPKLVDLAPAIAAKLNKDPALAQQLVQLLQSKANEGTDAAMLVGKIDATKVVVATRIDVAGDFNM